MSAVAYAALVAAERSGMVPHQHVGLDTHAGVEAAAFFVGGGVVFFYVFAYLAQTLASQLRDTAAEIERQRRELAESYEKEQLARDGMILLSRLVQHDVYSPLGVVSAACEEVRARCEDEDWEGTRHYISIIGSRLRSIESAVTSLSMFGEAEANEYGPPSDLHDVVSELVRDLEAESRERAVTVQVSGDWPRIAKARSQVYHVIRNLLTNAIKCVDDDGTGRVDLIGERLTDNAGGWVVRVLDNGPGVSGEVLHRLQSRALPVLGAGRAGGGFGAGLLLSHNLAAGWGGSLTYEDAPERGSVFTITLPSEVLAE
ncbi:MAG: sensor histidine kinase [bacterium]